jgi:opacity protein-like surface antigen
MSEESAVPNRRNANTASQEDRRTWPRTGRRPGGFGLRQRLRLPLSETRGSIRRTGLAGLALLLALPAAAQDPVAPPSGKRFVLFPAGDIFPVYVADPHRPGNAAMVHFYTRTAIFDSSDTRTGLKAGGRFGVFRTDPATPGGRSWQVSLDAGLDAQFDSYQKLDNIGWDGNYGLTLTTASGSRWSFKLGLLHLSGHVGDEYAERVGRERIDYSREEVALGVAYRLGRGWRAYAEGGVAYKQLTEEQAPWRAEGGIEWESRPKLLGGTFAWYAAVDFSATQERDWRLDTAVQAGVASKGPGGTWRLGVEYYDGRVPLGEFFQDTEARFTLGIWVDH